MIHLSLQAHLFCNLCTVPHRSRGTSVPHNIHEALGSSIRKRYCSDNETGNSELLSNRIGRLTCNRTMICWQLWYRRRIILTTRKARQTWMWRSGGGSWDARAHTRPHFIDAQFILHLRRIWSNINFPILYLVMTFKDSSLNYETLLAQCLDVDVNVF